MNVRIQDFLSLGYLFLLLLGICRDAVFYNFLGINIIDYSNILDILLSPISYITNNKLVAVIIVVIILLIVWTIKYESKLHEKLKDKAWYSKRVNIEKKEKQMKERNSLNGILVMSALFISSFYLGTGIGGGSKLSSKIKKGNLEMKESILFSDGDQLNVNIIGQNSNYLFYVKAGDKAISISPIEGNVKRIMTLTE